MTIEANENKLLNEECERFQQGIELRLIDEADCSDLEQSFMRRHQAECPECAAFADALESLQQFEETLEDSEKDAIRETVAKNFQNRQKRRTYQFAAAAAVLLVVTTTALVGTMFIPEPSGDPVQFELSKGDIRLNTDEFSVGDHFSFENRTATPVHDDALLKSGKNLFVALEKHAEMRVVNAEKSKITLRLDKGRMAIHLVPHSGVKLFVNVPDGVIEVKGTVFVVKADGQKSDVKVVRGRVAVSSNKSRKSKNSVNAGFTYSFNRQSLLPTSTQKKDNLLALLGVKESILPTEQIASVDDVEKETKEPSEAFAPAAKKRPDAELVSPEMLLKAARACRAKKDWKCAVDNYGKVIKLYPNRPDAITTLVPMGQIMLENLKRPSNALDYFRKYQARRPKGALGQEALWGECNALRRLGRKSQEKSCLETYEKKYPGSLYSLMAKSRLKGFEKR